MPIDHFVDNGKQAIGNPLAVYFLLHFPSDCSALALPGTVPCAVRTFLTDPGEPGPARSPRLPQHLDYTAGVSRVLPEKWLEWRHFAFALQGGCL